MKDQHNTAADNCFKKHCPKSKFRRRHFLSCSTDLMHFGCNTDYPFLRHIFFANPRMFSSDVSSTRAIWVQGTIFHKRKTTACTFVGKRVNSMVFSSAIDSNSNIMILCKIFIFTVCLQSLLFQNILSLIGKENRNFLF